MKLKELREVIDNEVTIWLQDTDDNYLDANENRYIGNEYDDYTVIKIFNDRYKSISVRGITIILNKG